LLLLLLGLCLRMALGLLSGMDVGVLKSELQSLESKDRRQMIAFLLALEERDNQAYRQELARRIDDKDPTHWISLEELDRRLDTGSGSD